MGAVKDHTQRPAYSGKVRESRKALVGGRALGFMKDCAGSRLLYLGTGDICLVSQRGVRNVAQSANHTSC